MSTKQQIIKPDNITCCTCGKSVPRAKGFYLQTYKCCLMRCLAPMRQKLIDQETEKEEKAKLEKQRGSFSSYGGGQYAY